MSATQSTGGFTRCAECTHRECSECSTECIIITLGSAGAASVEVHESIEVKVVSSHGALARAVIE